MNSDQVLIISFWNPTEQHPQQGIFIQEQAAAICRLRENVVFLRVNVLDSRDLLLKTTVEESPFHKNKRITINLRTRLWKFWYVNPWVLSGIVHRLLRKRYGEINPAIIHANVVFPCGVVGYLLAKKMGARLLISEHWSKTGSILKHPLFGRIAMKTYLSSFAVICVSDFLSNRIRESTGHTNVITIPNIIDIDIYTYSAKLPTDEGKISMMCVARWKLPKRLDLIFDSLSLFAAGSSLNIELTVVGNGPQADSLKDRETPANLRIKWAGYLERQAIADLLHKSQLFLHASDIETFSIVTAEALSTGTPVLASDTGALPELINPQNGILVENTIEGWLIGLKQIVSARYDNQAIAYKNQNRYSSVSIGNNIISVYNSMIP